MNMIHEFVLQHEFTHTNHRLVAFILFSLFISGKFSPNLISSKLPELFNPVLVQPSNPEAALK